MNSDIRIFWNHVGREHGGLSYAPTIQKNTHVMKEQSLKLSLQRCMEQETNRFFKHDANTLIEISPEATDQPFIIVYCMDSGLQFSLHHKSKYDWWLVDIVDIEELEQGVFCVHDLFIDIAVAREGTYQVLDMDEFHFAYKEDVLTPRQYDKAMNSFVLILEMLNRGEFPEEWLAELVEEYLEG